MSNADMCPITAGDVEAHNRRASEIVDKLKSLNGQLEDNVQKSLDAQVKLFKVLGLESAAGPTFGSAIKTISAKVSQYEASEKLLGELLRLHVRVESNSLTADKVTINVPALNSLLDEGAELVYNYEQALRYKADYNRLVRDNYDLQAQREDLQNEAKRLNSNAEECQNIAKQLVKVEH
ncbi:hypothetical protein CC86DRAFT_411596 [Ophiobolus disseminans]|uniref:Uncharacterized protein n=1 Tax=Ophiobolus disseminans TaxID=1469910 RepID=A0A6A6ZKJ0_9PLEO|nr:hypothetical protein CC86DRAFT_411596 [Ophiobolus disseminans]